ncbi:MAG: type II toxin-antitoxin system HipA family toxin [Flavobacteriales bacterium]|jgi:serine/threonine-protein kinase HipA|nr:type II toxin-antitoxin system HipA family toxin [Flavobacteriales bacterium]
MKKEFLIDIRLFETEIARLGIDPAQKTVHFQYNESFLERNLYKSIFPYIFRRIKNIQSFNQFFDSSFQGLPPMIADSLPDAFGNSIFKTWFEHQKKQGQTLTNIELLSYVGNRGMGALEFFPNKTKLPLSEFSLHDLANISEQILQQKRGIKEWRFNEQALLNIFKLGTSAGGARPKVLIAENPLNKSITAGDIFENKNLNYYIVKLHLEMDEYNKSQIEFTYHQLVKKCGIQMMDSKLIDGKHFATLRFDRLHGEKHHCLTASGMSGWDFKSSTYASYENLFKLCLGIKLPLQDLEELYRRMVFNVTFANEDDHLKNHSFIYQKETDSWRLSPAYDITYSKNPLVNYRETQRALSINNKRNHIKFEDLQTVAKQFQIKKYKQIIDAVQSQIPQWNILAKNNGVHQYLIKSIEKDFAIF